MRFACWITNVTDTHSEYVTNTAFPLQKRLCEESLMLRLHVHCLPCFNLHAYQSSHKFHIKIFWLYNHISLTNTCHCNFSLSYVGFRLKIFGFINLSQQYLFIINILKHIPRHISLSSDNIHLKYKIKYFMYC